MKRVFSEETKSKMRANHADFKGSNHPQWKGGKIETCCSWCGNLIKKTRYALGRFKTHFCDNECNNLWKKGKSGWNKGISMPIEQRMRQSQACKGRPSPFKGKHHTEEAKKKNSQSHLGRPVSEEHRAKLKKSCKGINAGIKNPMYGTTAWNKGMHPRDWLKNISYDEMLKRVSEGSAKKPTSLEQRIITIIQNYDLPFRYVGNGEIWISGYCPDFINNNHQKHLIEVFGNYWHKPEDENVRKEHFAKYGFETLILWENDLKKMGDNEVAQKIKAWEI